MNIRNELARLVIGTILLVSVWLYSPSPPPAMFVCGQDHLVS